MRHLDEPFVQQAAPIISGFVLRAIGGRRYEITLEGEQPEIEIRPLWGVGVSWSISAASYPSDPLAAEFLHRRDLFEALVSQWRKERNPLSSNAWDNVLNPAYRELLAWAPVLCRSS